MAPAKPATTAPPRPNEPPHRPAAPRRALWLLGVALAVAILAVPGPVLASTPVRSTSSPLTVATASSTGPSESWAWGAVANFSASVQYVGAYNNSQNLTGGNLTSSGAYVALDESVGLEYATYVIVNATTPSPSVRHVQISAAELRAEHVALAASGTFPQPGNYSANASIPIAPRNISLAASVAVLQVAVAFLNFSTGSNGSLALSDEHVEFAEGVNISLAASQFPNVTRDAAGDMSVRYTSGSIQASAWMIENLTATFSPALPLVEGPLFVGKSWNASSNATFVGTAAWAETVHYLAPNGRTAAASQSGSASANATAPVALACRVAGTTVVRYPDGSAETDDVIACTNATGSSTYLAANGLVVLPSANPNATNGLVAAVPERPASAPASQSVEAKGASVYSPSHRFATSEKASPSPGESVTASPMSPAAAQRSIHELGTPTRPAPAPWEPSAALILGVMVATAIGSILLVVALARRQHRVR
ncbi:MAG: hypothetical protein L3K18_02710 [Thermoplasmata archaeon]|nr:hypothetical protein [Thermoplasmata archaeon]